MLERLLRKLIRCGALTVIFPDGRQAIFGNGDGPAVVVRIKDGLTALKLALRPDLYLGEAYMDGSLGLEQGSLWDLLDLVGRNLAQAREPDGLWRRAGKSIVRRVQQTNTPRAARRNVAHHYDLHLDFYRGFLDPDLQYSCGYFVDDQTSLEAAQDAKKQHIIAKLLLRPGQRVLDIGCGWGGLALSIARSANVEVHGITLSVQQLEFAQQRAREAELADRVTFALQDYREVRGRFDRIVSVGMFEHVGAPYYRGFFAHLSRLLCKDGMALVHAIGRAHGPDVTNAWIRKYIFPGGYIPSLSQVWPAVERARLWVTDLEILRFHYAVTLRAWRHRFLTTLREPHDGRFRRMWEFYLAASEMSFRHGSMMVFQLQLSPTVDALPRTRDYMFETKLRCQTRKQSALEKGA